MKSRSTTTKLFIVTQFIAEVPDASCQTDVIYIDFSKAFDKLSHSLIVGKLDAFGFCPGLLGLVSSYLFDRRQYVSVNGYQSNEYTVTSEFHRDQYWGPFIIFIDDIGADLGLDYLLYAYDRKIYKVVTAFRKT